MKKLSLMSLILCLSTFEAQASNCYYIDGRLAVSAQFGMRGLYLHTPFGQVPAGFHKAGSSNSATSADVRAFYVNSHLESAVLKLEVGKPGSLYIVLREDSSPATISQSAVVNCETQKEL